MNYTLIPRETLKELNPALTEDVFLSKKKIPTGFELKIPLGLKENFLERYAKIPYLEKSTSELSFKKNKDGS